MSITTSPLEREQAISSIAGKDHAQVVEDLEYWAIAVADHQDRFVTLTNEREGARELWEEAQAWVRLLVEDLQRRRAERLERPIDA